MTIPTIAFIRDTTLLSDDLVRSYMKSQQVQISRDFAPAWNQDATCIFVQGGQVIPEGSWEIWLMDHSSQAGALGFHTDDGKPRSYVGIGDALADGSSWVVTASHEALEMLADPTINRTVITGAEEFCVEVCDACEGDQFAHFIAGHHLSNFMLPSWWDPGGQAPFTAYPCSGITAPYMIAEDGYIGVRPIGGTWSQRFASEARTARQIKKPSSRTMRRFHTP